ncbi:MAG: conjugal transfer protein [Lachnospiraceae bacterium]|nr:conjugal transfer protein [Lachnospiraceae bacterium]
MQTRWISCPACGNKTRTMIRENTELKNFPVYCLKCKIETGKELCKNDKNTFYLPRQA